MKLSREEAPEESMRRGTLLREYRKKSKRNLLAGLLSGVATGVTATLLCLRYRRRRTIHKEGCHRDE